MSNAEADPPELRGRLPLWSTRRGPERPKARALKLRNSAGAGTDAQRWSAAACPQRKQYATREAPAVAARGRQRDAREGQARPRGVTERLVVARKPGNAGGAKEP